MFTNPGAFELAAFSKDINRIKLAECSCILQSLIVCIAIADKPSNSRLFCANMVSCLKITIIIIIILSQ